MLPAFSTFGDLLKFLRRRARLTQKDLSIAVGYSESHISRLEGNERPPDPATLAALFIPVLRLEKEPELVARMMDLAAAARGETLPGSPPPPAGRETAARTSPTPNNLPIPLTSFIGRAREIAEVTRLFGQHRLVTLSGPGGCGKSRLALRVAEALLPTLPHGVWLVELASLSDPALVLQTIAAIFGVQAARDRGVLTTLNEFLRPRQLLLILDNCEHLIAEVAAVAETLLSDCPHLHILATSRETLNVSGEITFRVPPLRLPSLGWVHSLERVAEAEAVKLFVERARASQPTFALTGQNAAAVVQICSRLDGIPLAIELAAARIRFLQAEQIAARLDDRFSLLTGGSRTALPRHQTLHALVDWSYDLLSEAERAVLARLSVFSGGWTLDAAEAVASDPSLAPVENVLEYLAQLANKSLVIVDRRPGAETRYTMLETIREYAREKLSLAEETALIQQRHLDFFNRLALEARLFGNEKGVWLDRLEAEHNNIRTALARSLETDAAEKGAGMILAIVDFYWFRGFTAEARVWMDKFLATAMPKSPLHALLLQKAGWFARGSGDFTKADKLLKQALEMAREIGDKNRASWALGDLGLSARDQGNSTQALSYFSESLTLARESGEIRAIGVALFNLAESHELAGNPDVSMSLWEQGLQLFREQGDKTHIAWGVEGLAGAAFLSGDFASALEFHIESLKTKVEVMDKLGIAYSLDGLAQVAAAEGEAERAAILWGAADQLRTMMNTPPDPSRRAVYASLIPSARVQLGEELFNSAWAEGQAMTVELGITFALGENQSNLV